MSYERTIKDSVEYIANKFAENPGHFAATILRMYWDIEKQRDQFKAENEKLRERNKKLEKRCNQKVKRYLRGGLQQMKIEELESKYDGMKTERDTLIDDLSWYKAKVSRLERENRFLLSRKDNLFDGWRDENKRSVAFSKRLEQLERENRNLKNENKAILS